MERIDTPTRTAYRYHPKLLWYLVFFMVGCSGTKETVQVNYADDGYYKNHVNSGLIRKQISEGFESILRVQNNMIYRTYQFYSDDMPLESEVRGKDLNNIAPHSYLDDHSTAGTAIVLGGVRGKYAMLTAAHAVFYPDTIWHYQNTAIEGVDKRVRAVSVKRTENFFVLAGGRVIKLDLAVYDTNRDLAIMINSYADNDNIIRPLMIPFGDSDHLDWADMIYAMGYPKGAKMVTLGTASLSDHPIRSILIDASFNRGFSGGGIFAIRNNGTGLEFLGVVTSALGENETFLIPENIEGDEFNPELPYSGNVFVKTTPRINYGITNAVSVNEIKEFLNENKRKLSRSGIVLPDY